MSIGTKDGEYTTAIASAIVQMHGSIRIQFRSNIMNPHPIIERTFVFTSVGDLFMFIGILVSIGAVGVFAIYKIIREFYYND